MYCGAEVEAVLLTSAGGESPRRDTNWATGLPPSHTTEWYTMPALQTNSFHYVNQIFKLLLRSVGYKMVVIVIWK